MIKGKLCSIHKYHYPKPISTELHHIWPKEYHGPTEDWNLVEVGSTCHENVHRVLDALLKNKPVPRSTRSEKKYAEEGYKRIMDYGASLTPL